MHPHIRHTLGKDALPGHAYQGGCFHVRVPGGAWVQWGYGYNGQSYVHALKRAEDYCATEKTSPLPERN